MVAALSACLGSPGEEGVVVDEQALAAEPCYSTVTTGDCTDVYKTFCGGVLQCETHVQKCLSGGPCISESSGPNCGTWGHNLGLPACPSVSGVESASAD
jgi:hypothetical protein